MQQTALNTYLQHHAEYAEHDDHEGVVGRLALYLLQHNDTLSTLHGGEEQGVTFAMLH